MPAKTKPALSSFVKRGDGMAANSNREIPYEQWRAGKQEKLDNAFKQLEQGVLNVFTSEQYADYLSTMSKFHNYSYNNSIMIFAQKSDASLVAGYNKWQNEFDRHVKKGETAIQIFAPYQKKVEVESGVLDPKTKQPVMDPATGQPKTQKTQVEHTFFKLVPIFDISQTEGKPLPTLTSELTGSVEEFPAVMDGIKELAGQNGFTIAYEDIPGNTKGYCSPSDNRIAINIDMSEEQTMKTAIHELVHSRLHVGDAKASDLTRETAEIQAESVAFVVSKHFGLDTGDYSFPYVANWSSGRDITELRDSLTVIQKESSQIITGIEKHLSQSQAQKEELSQASSFPVNNFSIYQLKHNEITRDLRFTSLNQLRTAGLPIVRANYDLVYTAPLSAHETLDSIYTKFNINHPADFTGHSLSVSDVVTIFIASIYILKGHLNYV